MIMLSELMILAGYLWMDQVGPLVPYISTLLFFCCSSCWGDVCQKILRLCRFKSDRDKILQECSSGEYASIDESYLHHVSYRGLRLEYK